MERASARELWLTDALKSSPPPELTLEKTVTGAYRVDYITLVTLYGQRKIDYQCRMHRRLCDTTPW